MTTTLSPSFLRAVCLMTAFKPKLSVRVQAALVLIGLQAETFTAADLPSDIADGNTHVAGAATGNLISIGILTCVGRVKSPRENAKGRKLDLLRIVNVEKAKSWLRANGIEAVKERQEVFDLCTTLQ